MFSKSSRLASQSIRSSSIGTRASSNKSSAKKAFDPVIFSGIQPTGTPHLGNLLGFFLPYLDLQRTSPASTPLYLSIVGMHSITIPQVPKKLVEDRRNMLAALIAAGVDPERTCLYFQEDISEHAELMWYLNTLVPVGHLKRMTTWKSKLVVSKNANSEDEISEGDLKLGLLSYPVLQAADIMLYKSTIVPVGDDQQQHLELARDIAQTFNRTYGPTFPLPEMRIVPSKRILSLRDPSQKMSKSAPNPASRITITSPPAEILKNLKSAVTDSLPGITYSPSDRPGLSNLLLIWSALDEHGRTPEQIAEMANEQGWGMGRLKQEVADRVIHRVEPIRKEYERVSQDTAYLSQVAKKGRETARAVAQKTMEEVRRVVGLAPL